jgi:hypothetical protein
VLADVFWSFFQVGFRLVLHPLDMKIWRLHVGRLMLTALLLVAVPALVVLASLKGRAPIQKPDPAHRAMVQQKQSAWLEKHPLLLIISRSQIAGMPGDLLTRTCWHIMGALKSHPHAVRAVRRPTQNSKQG